MTNTSKRGFAAMDPEKRRETASKGGRAAHQKGTAHQFAPEEAREAGRKGGQAVSRNREHMAAIGRKGRQSAAANMRAAAQQATSGNIQSQQDTNGHTQPPMTNWHAQSPQEVAMRKDPMSQNAVEMLKADHTKVDTLFEQYEAANGQTQKQRAIVDQICTELDLHAKLEEELFYPAMRRKARESEEMVNEAIHEHGKIKEDVRTLRSLSADEEDFDSTVQSLMECVQHHVEEEENEMFPKAEQQFGDALNQLGAEMQQRKQQLKGANAGSQSRMGFMPQESSMGK